MTASEMIGTFRWEVDPDGIVVLTMDDPAGSANTMSAAWVESVTKVNDRLEAEKANITGVVITSAKKTFFAGGNLNEIIATRPEDAQACTDNVNLIKKQLRRLETLGRPVVAAGAWQGDTFVADLYVITTPHRVRLVVDADAGTAVATWNTVPLTKPDLTLHLRSPLMTRPDVA